MPIRGDTRNAGRMGRRRPEWDRLRDWDGRERLYMENEMRECSWILIQFSFMRSLRLRKGILRLELSDGGITVEAVREFRGGRREFQRLRDQRGDWHGVRRGLSCRRWGEIRRSRLRKAFWDRSLNRRQGVAGQPWRER